jgi:hypothetical protein
MTNPGKIQIDRTREMKNWANKMKDVEQNEKDINVAICCSQ